MLTPFLLLALAGAPAAAEFDACLAEIRAEAKAEGVRGRTLLRALKGVEPDASVVEAMETQPEFETPVWEYLARLVDDKRIADGNARLVEWEKVLARAEQEYGVDRYAIVAVWGVETDYGRIMGRRALVRSLLTASCFGPRQRFFRRELIATLQILQSGDVRLDDLKGSWAGAFGQTQFMPTTFQRMAVDFDGDGRRDLVGSVPDALGSVANFLKRSGWKTDQPWGYEVRLPGDYGGPSGRLDRRDLAEWSQLGIKRIDGKGLVGEGRAALLLPTGTRGPAFIVFKNFDALHAYNASEAYALAIALLSDRLKGFAPVQAPWPVEEPMLSRGERRQLQELLIGRGFYAGDADGIMGSRTVVAIKAFQRSAGLPADGYANATVLKTLRDSIPPV